MTDTDPARSFVDVFQDGMEEEVFSGLFMTDTSFAFDLLQLHPKLETPASSIEIRPVGEFISPVRMDSGGYTVELTKPGAEQPFAAAIFWLQKYREPEKRWAWPQCPAKLSCRLRCPSFFILVAPDPEVAAWCREPFDPGHGPWAPYVIGPSDVPVMTDPERAEQHPSLNILSLWMHGRGPHASAVAQATVMAFETVEYEWRCYAIKTLWPHLNSAARESHNETFARRYLMGQANALEELLRHKFGSVDKDILTRIYSGTQLQMDDWLDRFATASTPTEIFLDN